MNPLATIGYETDTQSGMIDRLKAADVELVIDVRAVASSRKAGFSKTLLAGGLIAVFGGGTVNPTPTPTP